MKQGFLLIIATFTAAAAFAQTPRPTPTTAPTKDSNSVATTQPSLTPEIEKVLDSIEAAGKKFRTLTANVEYAEEELLFGEKTVYSGKVYYKADDKDERPAWFRVHFDKVKAGRVVTKEDRDYAFLTDDKGQWFITRNARTKQYIQHHVAAPGDTINPLKLDQARFPLPFGQKKADVLELFDVATRKPTRRDPKDTTYLKLTPKPNAVRKLKVRSVELWVGADGLPVQVRSDNANGEVRQTTKFTSIDKKTKLADKVFRLPKPRLASGWEVRTEPLPEKAETK